jgi:hypothetical protein
MKMVMFGGRCNIYTHTHTYCLLKGERESLICGGGVKSRTPMLMRAGRGVGGAARRGGGGATAIDTKVEKGGAVE